MKAFGKEMKKFGQEMKHIGRPDHPTAPVPPTPPTPTPPAPPVPPTPAQPHRDDDSHLFTAGPSGHDFRSASASQAQPTEPVTPPEPFTEEPADQPSEAEIIAMETSDTNPTPEVTPEPQETDSREERLRVLEALEKGEIDIEDALARLESNNETS